MWKKIKAYFKSCTCCEWKEFYTIHEENDGFWDTRFFVVRDRDTREIIGDTYNTRGDAIKYITSSQDLTNKLAEKHLLT